MNWETLDPELRALLVTVIGALAATVIAYLEKLRRDLKANTETTEQIHKQTNGERTRLIAENQKLKAIVKPYRDLVQFLKSDPAGAELVRRFADQHRTVVRDEDVEALERRLTGEDGHL